MPLGTQIFGANRLIRSNAVVTIERSSPAPAGGTVVTWSTLKANVDVLVTTVGGTREFESGSLNERATCAVSGVEPLLSRPDVRLRVTAVVSGLAWLRGLYLSVRDADVHPRGSGGLLGARVSLNCSVLTVPSDDGAEL